MHQVNLRTTRRAGVTAVLVLASLATACGTDDSDSSADDGTTPTQVENGGTGNGPTDPDQTGDESSASDTTTASDSSPDESSDTPSAWPDGVPLPTAVDPAGVPIAGSLVPQEDPPDGDVMLFTFSEAENTALQSAFTGVGAWAQDTFEDYPNGTPCVKDDASRAALAGGTFSCDGMLTDGRLIQIATSLRDGRMSLDVVVKRP